MSLLSTAIYLLSHSLALRMNFAGIKILPLGEWGGKLFDFRYICYKCISLFWCSFYRSHLKGTYWVVCVIYPPHPPQPPLRLWFLVNSNPYYIKKNQYWRYCKGEYAKVCKVTRLYSIKKTKKLSLDGAIWHSRYLLRHFWMNPEVLGFLQDHIILINIYIHIYI